MTPEEWDAVLAEAAPLFQAYAAHQLTGRMDAPPEFHAWKNWLIDEDGGARLYLALLSAALRERESAKDAERLRDALREYRNAQFSIKGDIVADDYYAMALRFARAQDAVDEILASEKGEQT